MKASVKDLSNALKRIVPFVGIERAFENILLEINANILTIKALNGISNARIKINVQSDDNFSFAIKGSEFNNIINTFKDFIDIELNDNFIVISEKKSKIKLNILNINCFPEKLPDVDNEMLEVPSAELLNGIKNAIEFTDTKTMAIISGINIDFNEDILTVSATDGIKLSVTNFVINSNIKQNITIPLNTAKELIKNNEEFKISVSDTLIKFDFDNFVIVSNLLNGEYPPVKQMIPKEYNNIAEFKKSLILDILKRASLLNTKKQEIILMKLSENKLEFLYTNNDNNSLNEILDIDYTGCELNIKCNYVCLQTIINNLYGDVKIKLGEQSNNTILFDNNENIMILALCS